MMGVSIRVAGTDEEGLMSAGLLQCCVDVQSNDANVAWLFAFEAVKFVPGCVVSA